MNESDFGLVAVSEGTLRLFLWGTTESPDYKMKKVAKSDQNISFSAVSERGVEVGWEGVGFKNG